jgi:D-beta-D-heptose 7-phosphate kinase/D-beta-D-heptose 1-phosphate adenosyltransferase
MDASVIDRLAQATVVVIGDVLLDRFVEGKVGRVSPEAPVAVLNHRSERSLLGGAGNVAANLVAYGAHAILIGVAGDDPAAAELRTHCAGSLGLDCRLVADASRPTTVKTRYLSGWHQLLRVDAEDASPLAKDIARALLALADAAMAQAGSLVLSDYAKGVLDAGTIPALIAAARAKGIPVVVDPKKADASIFEGATLLTPNADEMARFAGMAIESDADAEEAGARVLDKVAVDAILITRGEHGMTLCRPGEPPLHVAAETHRVFDVTGAGDTVAATLAAALAAGLSLSDAVRLANAAAGVAVTKPGTATVSPAELKQALGVAAAANVMTPAEARDQVAAWRRQGLKVGFTNGCFDLLHRGHLHSLDQAARRVDRLVVGLNSDASTARLKGPGRPVQDLDTRAAVLAALKYVDLVVPFDEDTPGPLIETIVPDVLFKGADYAEADVVGGAFVKANGGRVELLPLLPGYSTTATVGRIRSGEGKPRD